PNILYRLIKKELVLGQVNSSSLLGIYGDKIQSAARKLVRRNLVQLIGTGCHSIGRRKPNLAEGLLEVERIGGKPYMLLQNNQLVIENQDVLLVNSRKIKNGIITKLRRGLAYANIL
ncbi:MAG: CpsB/CapC family capsule biosynthesis tyrosine phosphatase, partial [Halanaerobiales bacterium]